MATPRTALIALAILATSLTGCATPDPNTKPTYTCTPATGTPGPCYKAEHDLQIKQDKLYTEAEAVFRKFVAEDERLYRKGGIGGATSTITQTATGDFLKVSLATYQTLASTHTRLVSGTLKVAWLKRAPELASPGSVVALKYCLDASKAKLSTAGAESWFAGYTSNTLQFVREDGALKISSASGDEVDRC